uniref:Uncharacterized protein n=2 Tax=viral metagenome TaxID=1070528 RepID=A0A6M3MEB9_9ZZZZ
MPYRSVAELPPAVKDLPTHAKEIYMAAFNAAFEQYKDRGEQREALAHGTAWAAVKTKYKKNDDGNWVAKEAKVDEIKDKHAEILQEYGRRNAVKDAARIHKIIELLQELLDTDEETRDAEKVKKVVKEADACLLLVKEQAVVKTEDGAKYPIEAFVYAPDSEKPSDWKLRIWEDLTKKVTKKQLTAAAQYLTPGGYKGQRVDIPKEGLAMVKRKLRTAFRKLEVADEDIPKWVQEAETRTVLSDYVSLSEATVTGKGIATVVVIKPGLNSSGERYYPPEVLARDFSLFEGVKMYADHPTSEEEKERPERSIKDWVATLKNVHVDKTGQIIGEAVVVEPWMQAKLAALRDKNMLQEMGISINAVGTASKGEIEGAKTNVIERIVRVRSVDFVTEPGAGGEVRMYEAEDADLISLETLKERRPDLVKAIEVEVKAGIIKEVKKTMELEEKVKELETGIETLTKERDELKAKISEAEKATRIAEAKSVIDEAISKSELPEAAKKRLAEKFAGAESAEGIVEAVKAESDYVAALRESGKVTGMGGSKPDPEADHKALVEAFKRTGMSDKEAEIAAAGR